MRKTKIAVAVLTALTVNGSLKAAELKIVDVRRNIPLSDDEPVFKDFYINGGAKDGLKPNLVITAIRKTSIRDASGTQSLGELSIPVAQVRVVFVAENLAVAREYKVLSRDDLPMLEQIGVMSGDVLDLKGSFIDKQRKPDSVSNRPAPDSVSNRPAPDSVLSAPAAVKNTAEPSPALPNPLPIPQTSPMKAIIGTPLRQEARTDTDLPVPR
jgi:hypothetical protein